jgi:hypothetical protein
MGELYDAELVVADLLDERPDDLDALSLYAKIKHMRGELSQAIACWAHIHARSPPPEAALQKLQSILQLALDPERGAGEFLALGQYQLVRKPAAYLDLEEAFAAFVARKPDQAKLKCEAVARKHKGSDRETYKLAVLAAAWVRELSGDLEGACRALEDLGTERGFETDVDRVLALARLYEQLGGQEKLEAALHICQFLERRHHRMSISSRLAALHKRMGHPDAAKEYERRYAEAFRARMHRPSFAQVVRVASCHYLPLPKLGALHFWERELPGLPTGRQRAIAAALNGQLGDATEGFLRSGALLDRKYLADLTAMSGALDAAALMFREVLEQDGDDVRVICWLLEHYARSRSELVADLFRKSDVGSRTRDVLLAAVKYAPMHAALWRALGELYALAPDDVDEGRRCRERAEALSDTARRDASPVGRALAAAVYHFVGNAKGLVHEVWASREIAPSGQGGVLPDARILGNLSPQMRTAVQNTFVSVREYARSKFPHLTRDILDYTYTYKVTKDDEPSHGLSAGLPAALAFLSVFLQRPVPQDIASTGVLVADAHDVLTLRPVGDSEHKVKAAYNRNLRVMLMPAANRNELEANGRVPAPVREEIVRFASDLDTAVRLVFGDEPFSAVAPLQLVAASA